MNLAGSYNGLAFGPGTPYHVSKLQGLWDLDNVSSNDLPRSAGSGSFAGRDRRRGRQIILGLTMVQLTVEDYDALIGPLVTATDEQPADLPLRLAGNTVYVYARPRRRTIPIDAEYPQRSGVATIEFFCADPTVYVGAPP